MVTQYLMNLLRVLDTQEMTGVISSGTKKDLVKVVEHLLRIEEEKAYETDRCR